MRKNIYFLIIVAVLTLAVSCSREFVEADTINGNIQPSDHSETATKKEENDALETSQEESSFGQGENPTFSDSVLPDPEPEIVVDPEFTNPTIPQEEIQTINDYLAEEIRQYTVSDDTLYFAVYSPGAKVSKDESGKTEELRSVLAEKLKTSENMLKGFSRDMYACYFVYDKTLYRYFIPTETLENLYSDSDLVSMHLYSNYYIMLETVTPAIKNWLAELNALGHDYKTFEEAVKDGQECYFDNSTWFCRYEVLTGKAVPIHRTEAMGDPFSPYGSAHFDYNEPQEQIVSSEDSFKAITDPKEFVALFIKALREGETDKANLLCGERRFNSLSADKSLEKDLYAEGDGCNRLITVKDGFIVCENVSSSDIYFAREGDCLGYAIYLRNAGDRFVVEAVGKYAFEFALCDAENYLRFPYAEDFCVYLYNGSSSDYYYSEEGFCAEYSYPKDTLVQLIICAIKKGDFTTLKHICRNNNSAAAQITEIDAPVISYDPFGFTGRAKDVSVEYENDVSLVLTVTTEQDETIELKVALIETEGRYAVSTIEVMQ